MMKRLIAGLAVGAGLMYLLDPKNGKERRRALRDKIDHARSSVEERMNGGMDTAEDYAGGYEREFGRASERASRSASRIVSDARDARDFAAETTADTLAGTPD